MPRKKTYPILEAVNAITPQPSWTKAKREAWLECQRAAMHFHLDDHPDQPMPFVTPGPPQHKVANCAKCAALLSVNTTYWDNSAGEKICDKCYLTEQAEEGPDSETLLCSSCRKDISRLESYLNIADQHVCSDCYDLDAVDPPKPDSGLTAAD